MVIITTDGKQHNVIEREQIFYYDIFYFKYVCDDGIFYEAEVKEVLK